MDRPRLVASLIVGVFLFHAAVTTASADSLTTAAPGYDIAQGIANLARTNTQADVPAVAAQLKLPEMAPYRDKPGTLTWNGPLTRNSMPIFYAVYDPPHSSLHITHLTILWRPTTASAFAIELRVWIAPGYCPSEALLAQVVGSTPHTDQIPVFPDGYPGSGPVSGPNIDIETTLAVQHARDSVTTVTYKGHNTCFLIVTGRND